MVDWMVEVTGAFHCDERVFFLSVSLMDLYLKNEPNCLGNSDLHWIGLTAMCLASKFEDKNPLSMNSIFNKIGHKQIPLPSILQTENWIFKTLNFSVSLILSYDILTTLIENFVAVRNNEE